MLDNWLRPVPPELWTTTELADFQFGKKIRWHAQELPDLSTAAIALLGIGDEAANAVRQALYRLSFPFNNLQIVDLGNARKTDATFLAPLLKELLDGNILPLVIGAAPHHLTVQYKAFQSIQSHVNLTVIDKQIALCESEREHSAFYLNDIVLHARTRLFHLSMVGCQAHYTSPVAFQDLDKRQFDCMRLGNARSDIQEVEPLIRDADLAGFQIAAIRAADAPAQAQPVPSGFTAEEACQIARYAGMSDKLRSFGIFGFEQSLDNQGLTAELIAQMVWYFVDGFYNRKQDFPVSTEGLTEYIVDFKQMDYQLIFWKSNRSGRWWMQVPVKIGKKYNRHRLIPCSYNDYKRACEDELPDRLLHAYKRFL